jgi:uncharacterized protein YbjQ (UPF0145 family)
LGRDIAAGFKNLMGGEIKVYDCSIKGWSTEQDD